MKSKLRKIVVGGAEYLWTIKHNADGDGNSTVTILAGKRDVIYKGLRTERPITPSVIRQIIQQKTAST